MKVQQGYVIVELAVGYACSLALGMLGYTIPTGLFLIALGLFGAFYYVKRSGKLTDFRALLVLSWLVGEGIAAFKLSYLQSEWTLMTWLSFGGFFLCFLTGFEVTEYIHVTKEKKNRETPKKRKFSPQKKSKWKKLFETQEEGMEERLYRSIWIVSGVTMFTFIVEAIILKFVPLFSFSKTPTYDLFHVTGLHYFTVSCMFTHALTLIYFLQYRQSAITQKKPLLIANIISISIPIMCVSKFQFLLTILLPVIIFLQMTGDIYTIDWKRWMPRILGVCAAVAVILIALVMRRNYQSGYLESIFEMKNPDMPMLLQYIYIYVANNFDNFNCLTIQLPAHSMGMKMLFPIFALTGLKFVFPQLINYPNFVTKTELTTLTIIYDAYYDFGLIGVLIFGLLLGIACEEMNRWSNQRKSPFAQLFYGLTAICIMLSFFSTWFSNPTIWFYYTAALLLWIYVSGIWKNVWEKKVTA